MTYTINLEIDKKMETELQKHPQKINEWARKWQGLNPEGLEFSFSDHQITINMNVPD